MLYGMASNITTPEKVRENRIRRMAERQGLVLTRSRRRDPQAFDYGRYWLTAAVGGQTVDECEGCNEQKTIPMMDLDPGTGQLFPGLCAECVEKFGMQIGRRLRLRNPGLNGATDVQFLSPSENAIRVRYPENGFADLVAWSEFDRSGFASLDEVERIGI